MNIWFVFVGRRLIQMLLMAIAMALITTLMLHRTPSSYCATAAPENVSKEWYLACEERHHQSVWKSVYETFQRLLWLDLGRSLRGHHPTISSEIKDVLPYTLKLGTISFILSLMLGLIMGVVAAWKRHHLVGRVINWVGISLLSLPNFVIAIFLIQIFAKQLGWFAIIGDASRWSMMILPVTAITLPFSAGFMRITRNALVDVLNEDYIRTAEMKGLRGWSVFIQHALRNALGPIIPIAGLALTGLFDGSLLIEVIFRHPGLGQYTWNAISSHDYPAIQGVVFVVLIITTLINLFADLAQAWFFPNSREDIASR